MIKILFFLLGFKKYTLSDEGVRRAVRLFLRKNINIRIVNNEFYVPLLRCKKIEGILRGKVEYTVSAECGFGGFVYRNRKKYGIFAAVILFVFLLLFSVDTVWDVRIEGSEFGNEEKIKEELENIGFGVGSRWSKTDRSRIEVNLLSSSDLVSWVNINRRGGVAYVNVIDKFVYEENVVQGYANIVAKSDCIIEEVTVFKGVAAVKPGDVVEKGDILISGVIPLELGGGFCFAEGYIKGRVFEKIETVSGPTSEVKVYSKSQKTEINVNFFKFSLNIFKLYRNPHTDCDIIENEEVFTSLGGVLLPFSITTKIACPYIIETYSLSQEEMIESALNSMRKTLEARLRNGELVKIKTDGAFVGDAYVMTSEIIILEDVGVVLGFAVE